MWILCKENVSLQIATLLVQIQTHCQAQCTKVRSLDGKTQMWDSFDQINFVLLN